MVSAGSEQGPCCRRSWRTRGPPRRQEEDRRALSRLMLIRWTDEAVHDLTHICDYIEEHGSAAAARRVALFIHNAIDLLANSPEYGRTGRKPNTRELVFSGSPYLAVYRVHKNAVEIVRILHGAQKWPE